MSTKTYDGKVNAHSYLESGVDPLTGTFSANILLATLIDPTYEIRLCYSPLNLKDFGFGAGWRVPVSVYNKEEKLLSLSDGRLYKVQDNFELELGSGDVIFEQEGDFGYRVTFRDTGIIELLQNGETDHCPCIARYSAHGIGMCLTWEHDSKKNSVRLKEIYTEGNEDEKLLTINHGVAVSDIHIWPNQIEHRHFSLHHFDGVLNKIKNETFQPSLNWKFRYNKTQKTLLEAILTPTRLSERVIHEAIDFAGSTQTRVIKHATADSETIYQYTPFRFNPKRLEVTSLTLHEQGPALIQEIKYYGILELVIREGCFDSPYASDGLLHKRLSPYFKRVKDIKTTHRVYNRFNQITRSHDTIGGNVSLAEWEYDKFGRLTTVRKKNTEHRFEYLYPLDRKSALLKTTVCTPDARQPSYKKTKHYLYKKYPFNKTPHNDFFAHPEISIPEYIISTDCCDENTTLYEISDYHKYCDTPAFSHYLSPAELHTYINSNGISNIDSTLFDNPEKLRAFIESNSKLLDKCELTMLYRCDGHKVHKSMTFLGKDKLSKTTTTTSSRFTGLVLEETDLDGNTSHYTWDGLGRLTSTVNNPGTEFETHETFKHTVVLSDEDVAFLGADEPVSLASLIIHEDTSGRETVAGYDASNRHVQSWERASDDKWHLVLKQEYQDKILIRKTEIDYQNGTPLTSETYTHYPNSCTRIDIQKDNSNSYFDIICATVDEAKKTLTRLYFNTAQLDYPFDHESFILEPLYTLENDQISVITLDLALKTQASFGWCERETFDDAGHVIRLQRYSLRASDQLEAYGQLSATLHSSLSQTYGGNNKRSSFTDELGYVTRFDYDFFGRPTATHLADGTTISKSYPRHSDKALIERITVSENGKETMLGEQTFDSLGRLMSSKSVGLQTFEYKDTCLQPHTKKSNNVSIAYETVPALGGVLKSIKCGSLHHQFHYEKDTGLLNGFEDETGYASTLSYGTLTHLQKEVITPITGAATKEQSRKFSPAGKCIEYTDATGKTQTISYNHRGKVTETDDPDIKTTRVYGPFDRLKSQEVYNKKTHKRLTVEFTYNALGDEVERRIVADGVRATEIRIEQKLYANGQLAWRKISKGEQLLREENFTYNARHLLTGYTCSGSDLPVDSYNKAISKLALSYDALANITICTTHFGTDQDTAHFHYENTDVPCQLSKVTHTHADYPAVVELRYDANGCMTRNEKGQVLGYDALNRLKTLQDGTDTYLYHYDPQGRLRSRSKLSARTDWYYQLGTTVPVRNSECTGSKHLRITRIAEHVAALTNQDGRSHLLSADRMGTPLVAYEEGRDPALIKCTPFGISDAPLATAWSGELFDEVTGTYHLGERQYSPTLMRFTTPDSWSPFGDGGINCYAYLDPVNCPDPDGHISSWGWFGIAAAVVLGIVVGVLTMGAGLAAIYATGMTIAAGMMVAGGASLIAAGAVGIAAEIVRDNDPATAKTLDWVAFGVGIVGTILTLGAGFARGAGQTALRAVRSGAPRLGRMARYAVQERTLAIEMNPLRSIGSGGAQMQAEFIGGSRYAFSTASNMVSGVQSVGSTVALEMLARLAGNAPARLIGTTMGMEAAFALGIAAKHHYSDEEQEG